jgi:NAD(P)-dependent dehydrogenase (short-subunit alcohol dehydrogenase family)
MNNPVVLVTGGLSGIGRAAAVAFAKRGAKVVVAGRRDDAGKALVKELRSLGSEAEFINADVRKEEDVRALVDKTVARFGRLDVAVNNAGTEVRAAGSRSRPRKAMPQHSTPTFSASS